MSHIVDGEESPFKYDEPYHGDPSDTPHEGREQKIKYGWREEQPVNLKLPINSDEYQDRLLDLREQISSGLQGLPGTVVGVIPEIGVVQVRFRTAGGREMQQNLRPGRYGNDTIDWGAYVATPTSVRQMGQSGNYEEVASISPSQLITGAIREAANAPTPQASRRAITNAQRGLPNVRAFGWTGVIEPLAARTSKATATRIQVENLKFPLSNSDIYQHGVLGQYQYMRDRPEMVGTTAYGTAYNFEELAAGISDTNEAGNILTGAKKAFAKRAQLGKAEMVSRSQWGPPEGWMKTGAYSQDPGYVANAFITRSEIAGAGMGMAHPDLVQGMTRISQYSFQTGKDVPEFASAGTRFEPNQPVQVASAANEPVFAKNIALGAAVTIRNYGAFPGGKNPSWRVEYEQELQVESGRLKVSTGGIKNVLGVMRPGDFNVIRQKQTWASGESASGFATDLILSQPKVGAAFLYHVADALQQTNPGQLAALGLPPSGKLNQEHLATLAGWVETRRGYNVYNKRVHNSEIGKYREYQAAQAAADSGLKEQQVDADWWDVPMKEEGYMLPIMVNFQEEYHAKKQFMSLEQLTKAVESGVPLRTINKLLRKSTRESRMMKSFLAGERGADEEANQLDPGSLSMLVMSTAAGGPVQEPSAKMRAWAADQELLRLDPKKGFNINVGDYIPEWRSLLPEAYESAVVDKDKVKLGGNVTVPAFKDLQSLELSDPGNQEYNSLVSATTKSFERLSMLNPDLPATEARKQKIEALGSLIGLRSELQGFLSGKNVIKKALGAYVPTIGAQAIGSSAVAPHEVVIGEDAWRRLPELGFGPKEGETRAEYELMVKRFQRKSEAGHFGFLWQREPSSVYENVTVKGMTEKTRLSDLPFGTLAPHYLGSNFAMNETVQAVGGGDWDGDLSYLRHMTQLKYEFDEEAGYKTWAVTGSHIKAPRSAEDMQRKMINVLNRYDPVAMAAVRSETLDLQLAHGDSPYSEIYKRHKGQVNPDPLEISGKLYEKTPTEIRMEFFADAQNKMGMGFSYWTNRMMPLAGREADRQISNAAFKEEWTEAVQTLAMPMYQPFLDRTLGTKAIREWVSSLYGANSKGNIVNRFEGTVSWGQGDEGEEKRGPSMMGTGGSFSSRNLQAFLLRQMAESVVGDPKAKVRGMPAAGVAAGITMEEDKYRQVKAMLEKVAAGKLNPFTAAGDITKVIGFDYGRTSDKAGLMLRAPIASSYLRNPAMEGEQADDLRGYAEEGKALSNLMGSKFGSPQEVEDALNLQGMNLPDRGLLIQTMRRLGIPEAANSRVVGSEDRRPGDDEILGWIRTFQRPLARHHAQVVKGRGGEVPIIAHIGESIVNEEMSSELTAIARGSGVLTDKVREWWATKGHKVAAPPTESAPTGGPAPAADPVSPSPVAKTYSQLTEEQGVGGVRDPNWKSEENQAKYWAQANEDVKERRAQQAGSATSASPSPELARQQFIEYGNTLGMDVLMLGNGLVKLTKPRMARQQTAIQEQLNAMVPNYEAYPGFDNGLTSQVGTLGLKNAQSLRTFQQGMVGPMGLGEVEKTLKAMLGLRSTLGASADETLWSGMASGGGIYNQMRERLGVALPSLHPTGAPGDRFAGMTLSPEVREAVNKDTEAYNKHTQAVIKNLEMTTEQSKYLGTYGSLTPQAQAVLGGYTVQAQQAREALGRGERLTSEQVEGLQYLAKNKWYGKAEEAEGTLESAQLQGLAPKAKPRGAAAVGGSIFDELVFGMAAFRTRMAWSLGTGWAKNAEKQYLGQEYDTMQAVMQAGGTPGLGGVSSVVAAQIAQQNAMAQLGKGVAQVYTPIYQAIGGVKGAPVIGALGTIAGTGAAAALTAGYSMKVLQGVLTSGMTAEAAAGVMPWIGPASAAIGVGVGAGLGYGYLQGRAKTWYQQDPGIGQDLSKLLRRQQLQQGIQGEQGGAITPWSPANIEPEIQKRMQAEQADWKPGNTAYDIDKLQKLVQKETPYVDLGKGASIIGTYAQMNGIPLSDIYNDPVTGLPGKRQKEVLAQASRSMELAATNLSSEQITGNILSMGAAQGVPIGSPAQSQWIATWNNLPRGQEMQYQQAVQALSGVAQQRGTQLTAKELDRQKFLSAKYGSVSRGAQQTAFEMGYGGIATQWGEVGGSDMARMIESGLGGYTQPQLTNLQDVRGRLTSIMQQGGMSSVAGEDWTRQLATSMPGQLGKIQSLVINAEQAAIYTGKDMQGIGNASQWTPGFSGLNPAQVGQLIKVQNDMTGIGQTFGALQNTALSKSIGQQFGLMPPQQIDAIQQIGQIVAQYGNRVGAGVPGMVSMAGAFQAGGLQSEGEIRQQAEQYYGLSGLTAPEGSYLSQRMTGSLQRLSRRLTGQDTPSSQAGEQAFKTIGGNVLPYMTPDQQYAALQQGSRFDTLMQATMGPNATMSIAEATASANMMYGRGGFAQYGGYAPSSQQAIQYESRLSANPVAQYQYQTYGAMLGGYFGHYGQSVSQTMMEGIPSVAGGRVGLQQASAITQLASTPLGFAMGKFSAAGGEMNAFGGQGWQYGAYEYSPTYGLDDLGGAAAFDRRIGTSRAKNAISIGSRGGTWRPGVVGGTTLAGGSAFGGGSFEGGVPSGILGDIRMHDDLMALTKELRVNNEAMIAENRAYQQTQLGFQVRRTQLGYQQSQENQDLQERQARTQLGYQRVELGVQQQQFGVQTGWKRQDFAQQEMVAGLQYTWQQEDLSRNIRFSSGRDRIQLRRQQDRGQVMYGIEEGQRTRERSRFETQTGWQEEAFIRQRGQMEEMARLQEEGFSLQRKHMKQNFDLSMEELAAQGAHIGRIAGLEDARRKLENDWEDKQQLVQKKALEDKLAMQKLDQADFEADVARQKALKLANKEYQDEQLSFIMAGGKLRTEAGLFLDWIVLEMKKRMGGGGGGGGEDTSWPINPSDGQIITKNGKTWAYSGATGTWVEKKAGQAEASGATSPLAHTGKIEILRQQLTSLAPGTSSVSTSSGPTVQIFLDGQDVTNQITMKVVSSDAFERRINGIARDQRNKKA